MPSTKKRKFKRLFLAADLHGSEIVFRKFLAAATFYEADALLIGGDMTAKTIVPVVEGRDGRTVLEAVAAAAEPKVPDVDN